MATPKSTRIAIIVIAVMMIIGTIGSFAVIILANKNQQIDIEHQNAEMAKWEKDYEEYQKKLNAQVDQLSSKYYDAFRQYVDRPSKFDKDEVKELSKVDLKIGDGKEVNGKTKFGVYYLGWNSDGKVFDGSLDGDRLKSPMPVEEGLDEAALIEGWIEGLKGMKIGGVRELTIPSDLAYGENGGGNDDIPPNMPLKFVVMAIELPEEIPMPEMTETVMRNLYGQMGGQ